MQRLLILLSLFALCFSACKSGSDSSSGLVPTDLMKYGAPISINAPEGAKITSGELGIMKEIVITDDASSYGIQLYLSNAPSTDIKVLLKEESDMVKGQSNFDSMVEEFENGFYYKMKTDEVESYDFKYVHIMGDKRYVFSTNLTDMPPLADVKKMHQAVLQK